MQSYITVCSVHQCIATCSGVLQCAVCRTVVIVHEVAAALCTWHLDLRDTDAVNCKFSSQPSSINILVINVDYYLCIYLDAIAIAYSLVHL